MNIKKYFKKRVFYNLSTLYDIEYNQIIEKYSTHNIYYFVFSEYNNIIHLSTYHNVNIKHIFVGDRTR